MNDVAFSSTSIEQQQWVEIEVDYQPPRRGLQSLFGKPKTEKKKKRLLQSKIRWHTFFGIEIPHLTDFLSIYNSSDGPERREAIINDALAQQLNFLSRIAQIAGDERTLELRYLFWPDQKHVELAFICKVIGNTEDHSKALAHDFWQHFQTYFPNQVYGLQFIQNAEKLERFLNYPTHNIVEFRRHETVTYLGAGSQGYVVYPIQGSHNSINSLWHNFFEQPQPHLVSFCLRPIHLALEEKLQLKNIISFCRSIVNDRQHGFNIAAADAADIYTNYWYQLKNAFLFRLSVASPVPLHNSLLSVLSSHLAHPFQGSDSGRVLPNEQGHFIWPQTDQEVAIAQTNLRYLELNEWGQSIADPPVPRLRDLIGVADANSSFCIPIPPADGLPGIESRPLVIIDKSDINVVGDRNIVGDIHIHGPVVDGTIVIGGDIVGFGD